jgi:hypothetical protein
LNVGASQISKTNTAQIDGLFSANPRAALTDLPSFSDWRLASTTRRAAAGSPVLLG